MKLLEESKLTPRQEKILNLIVRQHINSATPVASRSLVERYNLEVSPATVRNEMAHLEELGYLYQPHTSAGRLPTEVGFRYFVERLMEQQTMPMAEQRMIAHQFYQARDHIEQWLPLAATVLSRTTSAASLLTAPRAVQVRYKHLELIATHGRAVLFVLVFESGMVEQQMLALPEPMTQTALSEIADRLNQACAGLSVSEIQACLPDLPALETEIANLVVAAMEHVKSMPSDEIYSHGISSLLQEPEFYETENSSIELIRVLEERSLLQGVLAETLGASMSIGAVRVVIGGEGRWDELRACSLVLARYGVANYASGALGVVGPIRMPYGRAVSVVRFVADVLSELVYEMYLPGTRDADMLLEPSNWQPTSEE